MSSALPSGAERLAAVAATSRAGASVAEAWHEWGDGVEWDARHGCLLGSATEGTPAVRVIADAERATRLSATAGVPLADVLDALARIEAQREEAETARSVAAAGPRASARTLMWLPAAGFALGVIVEPRVVSILASGLGIALIICASVLTWAGRRWLTALLNAAASNGASDEGEG